MKKFISLLLLPLVLTGCSKNAPISEDIKFTYGVFLGSNTDDFEVIKQYQKIVLEADEFSKNDIKALKDGGRSVYAYLNVGAIETYRDYYDEFKDITIGVYEHWEDERWIDVSQNKWKVFLVNTLAKSFIDKGVDGFYLDNSDVYYEYEEEKIFDGLKSICLELKKTNKYLMINGGDTFVNECINRRIDLHSIMDAVNQETVYTSIDWDNESYGRSTEEDRKYFKEYVETVKSKNLDVFLLEYGQNEQIFQDVNVYCYQKGFYYYFSDTIELVANKTTKGSQPLNEFNNNPK